jgi:hypothetical protein
MKNLLLICISVLLFIAPSLAVAENFVVSGVSSTVISLGNFTISAYPYGVAFPVAGAKWVWNQNWNGSPTSETITFFNRFNVACACKTFTLYITADNGFRAYLNGNFILSGNNWPTVYSAVVPSYFFNIGANTLEIVAANA